MNIHSRYWHEPHFFRPPHFTDILRKTSTDNDIQWIRIHAIVNMIETPQVVTKNYTINFRKTNSVLVHLCHLTASIQCDQFLFLNLQHQHFLGHGKWSSPLHMLDNRRSSTWLLVGFNYFTELLFHFNTWYASADNGSQLVRNVYPTIFSQDAHFMIKPRLQSNTPKYVKYKINWSFFLTQYQHEIQQWKQWLPATPR